MTEPILVVGAGPVGMTAALELTRRGLPVRLVEKALQRTPYSKALAVNPRSLELLEAAGVTPRLLAEGIRIVRYRAFVEAGERARVDFDAMPSRFPFLLGLPQARTEAILEAVLAERGVAIERGVEVTAVTQAGGRARLETLEGGRQGVLEAGCVLAADGAHSTLRKALGIGFPGGRAPQNFHMIDAKLAWSLPHDEVIALMHEHRPMVVLPLPEERCYRLICIEQKPAERLPPGARIERLDWESSFQVSYRLAERFTEGVVHLAGDAAHIHSPIGARGMNLGMEDACTFAMLAAKGELARYGAARRAVAEHVVGLTERLTSLVASQRPLVRWLRDALGIRLLALPGPRRRVLEGLSGLDHPNPVTG